MVGAGLPAGSGYHKCSVGECSALAGTGWFVEGLEAAYLFVGSRNFIGMH